MFSIGAGMLHRIGQLDSLQHEHILQHVMVPYVQMLYPTGIIHFQQDHSSIHDSRVVQVWLLLQAKVKFIDWPPSASYEHHREYPKSGEENAGNLASQK
jgi:hypothetical protein